MLLLICDETTSWSIWIIGLKFKRLVTVPKLALCMSFDFSSTHIAAYTEYTEVLWAFFFPFSFLNPTWYLSSMSLSVFSVSLHFHSWSWKPELHRALWSNFILQVSSTCLFLPSFFVPPIYFSFIYLSFYPPILPSQILWSKQECWKHPLIMKCDKLQP